MVAVAGVGLIIGTAGISWAKVTGLCSNCHTMHNSQNGDPMVVDGPGTGWAGGKLASGTSQASQKYLLVTGCVGCHSSVTDETIVTVGNSRIPIVFNVNGYPSSNLLAGGNFYWLSKGSSYDGYGHNVLGISAEDTELSEAPGKKPGCTKSCHYSLAKKPESQQYSNDGGCEGCHYKVYHHLDNDRYRFLEGHQGDGGSGGSGGSNWYVIGVEDKDWEQDPSFGTNRYQGRDRTQAPFGTGSLNSTQTISSFCAGCHKEFHNTSDIGSNSPWIRHPSDVLLPESGEYDAYDPVNAYSAEAPVAWVNPQTPVRSQAVVMCLSCHRPHASDQPDILRWDYDNMRAHDAGEWAGTGCFTCHTEKD